MTTLRFLVSLITKDNDYQMEQAAAAKAAAAELDVEVQIIYANDDAITQSTQLLKAIQAEPSLRPSGILVEPVGATSFPQVAKTAAGTGIGWAILSRHAEYAIELRKTARSPVFSVSADQVEVGRIQGRQVAALLPRRLDPPHSRTLGQFGLPRTLYGAPGTARAQRARNYLARPVDRRKRSPKRLFVAPLDGRPAVAY